MTRRLLPLAVSLAAAAVLAPPAQAGGLRAGVGKADITPQTGYYLGGWTRADRTAHGQHTRLWARAMVLERDGRKVALVAVDLFMVAGGMVKQIGDALAARGFSERNILISASHTHSGPGGYGNFNTFNTAAPSMETIGNPNSFVELFNPRPADPLLYTFLTRQITAAIAAADSDRAPAVAGWGEAKILGLTRNRSLEAHLANHGISREYGQGRESMDPGGYEHTIDPAVNVLRVDKLGRRRVRCRSRRDRRRRRCYRRVRVPIGAWSNYANHGTVTKSSFEYYNQDHHGSAIAVFEYRIRRANWIPRGQQVLNVYGNSDEGDMSAGLDRHGPAASDYVGRVEAEAMLGAWKRAGSGLSRHPELDVRWTRVCFCGQTVEGGGRVASRAEVGLPFFTGSEEGRGPLYDVTGRHFEGRRSPVAVGPHGHKLGVEGVPADVPRAVPLLAVRVGSRMLASVPGEGTKEVGARIRAAVGSAVAGSGVTRVVVSGLANEFILYFTTPEEHDRQHYEGGQTLFGRLSSVLIQQQLATLAGRLVRGEPAQAPFALDPTNGVRPNGPAYSSGAATAFITGQPPRITRRLRRVPITWSGGPSGLDRPVGGAFLSIERRVKVRRRGRRTRWRWRRGMSDLGLQVLWSVEGGRYRGLWEVPLNARRSVYRMVVRGKRYRLVSRTFTVAPMPLRVEEVPAGPGRVAVRLRYPDAVRDRDITHRLDFARGGVVRFRVGGRTVTVRRQRSSVFSVPAPPGASVSIPPRGAHDRHANFAGGVSLR